MAIRLDNDSAFRAATATEDAEQVLIAMGEAASSYGRERLEYDDGRLKIEGEIRPDGRGVDVRVVAVMLKGRAETVLQTSFSHDADPYMFRQGTWVSYLAQLAREASKSVDSWDFEIKRIEREQREFERRYSPIDDATLFEQAFESRESSDMM